MTAANGTLPRNETILAYVGPDVILMGDVLPEVLFMLKKELKGRPKPPDDQMEKIRIMWITGRLKGAIEARQLLVYARREIPEDKYPDVRKQMVEQFEKKRVPQLLEDFKENGVTTRADLAARSVELLGVPFSRVRESFVDQVIAYSFINNKLPKEEEVSHADALAHYQRNEKDYEFPAKSRWSQITVNYGPGKRSREEAYKIIAQCGNAIIAGAKFEDMARQHSDDSLTAKKGGANDWVGQGTLVAEKIDAALFDPQLPVGTLSPIIEDRDAWHLLRVAERRSAGKTSFAEAQKEIKEKIKKQRQDSKRREVIDNIKQQIPVRNAWEELHPPPAPPKPQQSRSLFDEAPAEGQ